MTRSSTQLIAVLTLFLFAIACKKGFNDYYDDKSPKGGYLFEKIQSKSEFSVFAKGLERANLVQFLDQGGLYTVFAPTNDAFTKFLTARGYSSIDAVPQDQLFRILSFHIVNNMWYYYDLKARYATFQQVQYLTRNKKFVNIDVKSPDTIKVNTVPVINSLRDIDAENGVIHGIPDVLVPLPNLEEIFQSDPELRNTTFYKLMQVVKDSAYDRFNSYDKNRDGIIDSVFYKTYPLLSNVFTSIEYRQNTTPSSQGGDPLFTTILIPSNDVLDAYLAPALAKIDPSVQDKIAALSPSYAEAVLESYFIADSLVTSAQLIARPLPLRAVNAELIPALTNAQFVKKDIVGSNGVIHMINTTFPNSSVLKSAIGLVMSDPDLSIFLAAIQRAGLMSNWAVPTRTGTFFAPTNAAFAAINLDVKLGTLNGAVLTATQFSNIVRHHLINENLTQAALTTPATLNKNSDLGAAQPLAFTAFGTTLTSAAGTVATVTYPPAAIGPGNPAVGYVYKVNQVLIPKP